MGQVRRGAGVTCRLLVLLTSGQVLGVLGQTMAEDQSRLIGVVVGGVVGAVLLVLLIVILYFLCRPSQDKQHHRQLMDYSHGSSSATPTRVEKYQHLPPGIWTSNPSLAPVLPPQPGVTRYTAYPAPSPHLQLQPNLHSSRHFYQPTLRRAKSALQRLPAVLRARRSTSCSGLHGYSRFCDTVSCSSPDVRYASSSLPGVVFYSNMGGAQSQLNLTAGQQEDMAQHMNISGDTTRTARQVDGKQTATARVFSEYAPGSNNFIQSAPTVGASNSPQQDFSDSGHGSRHMLTARVFSDLPPGGHQVKRTNSRTVHDYVPSILGGGGLTQQGGPLERGAPTNHAREPRSRWARHDQTVPGQLPSGVSHNGGNRGIYLRRAPSEAAVYASIPIMTSQVNDNPYDNYVLRAADAPSQPAMMASNPVRRSQSNVSSAYVPQHRYQINQVTAYSTSDIYAIPNKIPRHNQNATQPEIQEETSSITIMGSGGPGDSPPPPPLPPTSTTTTNTTTLISGQVHRTVRGTASLTLGPEEEDDYEELGGEEEEGDQREEAEPAGRRREEDRLAADVEVDEKRLEAALPPGVDTENQRLEAEVLEEHAALPPGVETENQPGGGDVPGGLKGPDLTRHLPEFDNTDIEEAHSAFKFLDQYSLCRESQHSLCRDTLSRHSLSQDSPSQQSSLSFSAGRVYMLSNADSEETVLDFSYLQAKGKHIADEAFRFLDELDDGDEASR